MIRITEAIRPRLKDSARLYKHLDKMQTAYGRVTDELYKYTKKLGAISSMVYTTPYQRKVTNMYNASRYVSQIIGMRMTCLAYYIKEMQNISDMITALNRINKK